MLADACPDKLEKLANLYRRGNLSEDEYADARMRIVGGQVREKKSSPSLSIGDVFSTLGSDLNHMLSDPEVIRRKKALADQGRAGLFSGSAQSFSSSVESTVSGAISRASPLAPAPMRDDDFASQQHAGHVPGLTEDRPRGQDRILSVDESVPKRAERTSSSSFDILGEFETRASSASTGPKDLRSGNTHVPSFYAPEDSLRTALLADGAEYDGVGWKKAGDKKQPALARTVGSPQMHRADQSGAVDDASFVAELYEEQQYREWYADDLHRQAQLAATQPAKQQGFLGLFGF